ncbi:MAG TPA: hypothetical protein VJR25_14485 [Microbacterium sp.]|uniref:hypothetical protein n=1 Tax=Microbacterium sp. TaxID=51671 RepID=UPI002B479CF0|nr:hypothetical protein [Microbacterium sp.]HKT57967.1 hypothetical protein [Microbacterium sp.]
MSVPDLAPRGTFGGIIAVWVIAAVIGIAVGMFVPMDWRPEWVGLGMAGCLTLSFAVQLAFGQTERFIQRVAASALGSLVVLGLIAAGFGLAALLP